MRDYENNAYFWQKIDTLLLSSNLTVIRKKGDCHPTFKNLIYPVDYGWLDGDVADANHISVYMGKESRHIVTAVVIAADILEKTLDVKILAGCNEEETEAVLRYLNQTNYQKTVLIRRGQEIPSWATTDN